RGPDMTTHPTPPEHGIIAGLDHTDEVRAAGSDYTELTVVGSLLVEDEAGAGGPPAGARPAPEAPSFAILCPSTLALSDPAVPLAETARYLRAPISALAPWATPRCARDLAAERGLEALLEPLHRGETDMVTTLAEGAAFLDAHGLGDMRMVADLFHVMGEGEDLAVVHELAGRVGHAHIADTDRRPPGQGVWPLAEFLTALREGGYGGHVSIECFTWQNIAVEGGAALAAVRAADPAIA